jgi:uncharacterized protein (DUF2141 family)
MPFKDAKKAKLLALKLAFFCLCLLPAARLRAQDIRIIPEHLKKEKGGSVWVCLFNSASGFPDDPSKILKAIKFRPDENWVLPAIPPGRYAIVMLHDLDGDNKMTYSFFGLPKEGFSCSPDGGSAFSKPVFEKAAFSHGQKGSILKVKFHYLP